MGDSLKIEYVGVDMLKPHPGNPRKHPDDAVAKLVKSIQHFGWTNPVLVDADGVILAGHARLKAAKIAGLDKVPVVRLPLSGPDAELYVIADNKTQELTEWDWPKLGDMFGELDTGDVNLELSGFDLSEIEGLVNGLDDAGGVDILLPSGEKGELEQITFTLTAGQKARVDVAIAMAAKKDPASCDDNTNKNGRALAEMAEGYINGER